MADSLPEPFGASQPRELAGRISFLASSAEVARGVSEVLAAGLLDELNRLGTTRTMEDYLRYIMNIVDDEATAFLVNWRLFGHSGHRGFEPGFVTELAWKELGEAEESLKPMQYWMRQL